MSCDTTLKEKGMRLTPQRRLILDIIHASDAHITGEEIVAAAQTRMPGVNKSTVYRTLELLERLGCVCKGEKDNRFIYHHAEEGHHHHLVCRSCGRSLECNEDLFRPVERKLAREHGFSVDFTHVVMTGLCRECKNKNIA